MKVSTKNNLIAGWLGCLLAPALHAGAPLWTYSAPNPASVTVSSNSTATVQYTVTNQSKKPKNLIMKSTAGLSASSCYLATKGSTCTLTVTINGSQLPREGIHSGPMLCEQGNINQCYQPSQANLLSVAVSPNTGTPILNASVSSLALKASGNSRIITITNNGDGPATNLTFSLSSPTPGTDISPSSTCVQGGTLAAGASCTAIVTPGAAATSNCEAGIAPTPSVATVSANGSSASINLLTLKNGCQYQGGLVFALDDSTPATGSVGGKVMSLKDQAAPYLPSGPQATSIIWGSNGASGTCVDPLSDCDVSLDVIPGIDETSTLSNSSPDYSAFEAFFSATYTNPNPWSTSPFSACNGSTDGQCNTGNIVTFYNQFITNYDASETPQFTAIAGPTNLNYYAAGLCKATINGYSDWYLPAICEMDSEDVGGANCPAETQSMVGINGLLGNPFASNPSASCTLSNLGIDCLAGNYWSSTEVSYFPQSSAWVESFNVGGSSQVYGIKSLQDGVRCVRGF